MSWKSMGGGNTGLGREFWRHEQAERKAALILAEECGKRHVPGERADLCPKCQDHAARRGEGKP